MASWLRCLHAGSSKAALHARSYTGDAAHAARRKWGLGGLPSPRSILEDDDAPIDLSEDNEAVNGARPNTPPPHLRRPPDSPTPHEWKHHRQTLRKDFPDGWAPPRKLSREAMDGLRKLHQLDPEQFPTPVLAERFRISPEAVRRILKSKWEPPLEKRAKMLERERAQKVERRMVQRGKEREEMRELKQMQWVKKDGFELR